MERSVAVSVENSASKMAIVDTFTRLIFGDPGDFSAQEQAIIEALREVEPNVAPDDYRAMGDYLRALGVAEMIALVARVERACEPGSMPGLPGDGPGADVCQQRGMG